MSVKLQRDQTESLGICFEHDIAWNGHSFLVIYGKHINGHYIAIPNWGVCCEAGYPRDSFYNTERLSRLDLPEGAAGAIASYIEEAVEVVDEVESEQHAVQSSAGQTVFQTGSISTSEDFDDLIHTSVQLERFSMGIGEQFSDGDLTINEEKYPGIYGCHEILFRYAENRGIDGYSVNKKLKETAQGKLTEEEFKHWIMTSNGADQHQRKELEQ